MRTLCSRDQSEYINEFFAGNLGVFSRIRLQAHHTSCPQCRAEWEEATQLRMSLQHAASVSPPPGLQARIWSQLPEIAVPNPTRPREHLRTQRLRWVAAGIGIFLLTTAGSVTAQRVVDPLRQQYAIMHEDGGLATPITPTEGLSGVTARLDGLYGHATAANMRWRVTGQVKVTVFSLPSGNLLAGGETAVLDKTRADAARSLLGPQRFSQLLGLNPVADPKIPPVLTVNENGKVTRTSGYGTFTVSDKWRFEIEPLLNNPGQ